MKYDFTDRTRKVLAKAREEAAVLGHDYVGPAHLLLGLLVEGGGKGVRVLTDLGVGAEGLRAEILANLPPGRGLVPVGALPYTSRGKKVLESSMAAARQSGRAVDTEHLLLGLMMEEKSLAAQVLESAGVTLDDVRQAVLDPSRRAVEGVAPSSPRGGGRHRDSVWFLEVDQDSAMPLYEQIVARLEEAVAMGRLEPGERLPSVRDLAAEVGIAPGTVARAYSELESRGVVVTEGARGTRVASDPPAGKASSPDRSFLERLLRRPVVAAFHRGATAQQMREALDRAMQGILKML